jgi:hypothetical protein
VAQTRPEAHAEHLRGFAAQLHVGRQLALDHERHLLALLVEQAQIGEIGAAYREHLGG